MQGREAFLFDTVHVPFKVQVEEFKDQIQFVIIMYNIEQPIIKLIIRTNIPWSSPNLTILSCCNSFNTDISRMAVDGTPSSSLSRRIFFNATVLPLFRSSALYTTP